MLFLSYCGVVNGVLDGCGSAGEVGREIGHWLCAGAVGNHDLALPLDESAVGTIGQRLNDVELDLEIFAAGQRGALFDISAAGEGG